MPFSLEHPSVSVVVGVCPPSPCPPSCALFLCCVLCSNLALSPSSPWRGPYSLHDLDSVTVAQAMALRHLQRNLQKEPEFSSTAMPVDSPPRTQPAPSPSRSLLQQIERRLADCEAAQAHRETPQRVSQLEHRLQNEIAALCLPLQAVATLQTQQAQVTSTLQQAVATHDQCLHFVAAQTAHVADAMAQQCPSANAPPGGHSVEQDAHMTTPERSTGSRVPVNTKRHHTMAQHTLGYGFG